MHNITTAQPGRIDLRRSAAADRHPNGAAPLRSGRYRATPTVNGGVR